jgi:hypothetical protein
MSTVASNINSLITLFSTSYVVNGAVIGALLLLMIVVYVGIKTIKISKEKTNWLVLLTVFFVSYLGIFLHGNPPSHYYMPIFAFPVIFLSLLLVEIWNKKGKYLVLALLALLTFTNFSYYFSERWFYQPKDQMVGLLVPYHLQLKTVRSIIVDANWKEYSFSRVGPFDYYEGGYAQNYRYLMWWLGNEPVENAGPHYIIYEGIEYFPDYEDGNIIFKSDDILVIKEKS